MVYKYFFETFNSFGYRCRIGLAGSYGDSIFNFFMNYHSLFHSSYPISHSYQQCIRVLVYPHPCQHLLFSVALVVVILIGVRWYLIVVLICISLMTNEVEYLSLSFLASSMYIFSQKCLFKSFAHFELICFCCLVLVLHRFSILIPYQMHALQAFFPIS